MKSEDTVQLVCPLTGQAVTAMPRDRARGLIADGQPLIGRPDSDAIGETPTVLVREDRTAAYPILNGVPILLGPERLMREAPEVDLDASRYQEAYAEMGFYNDVARSQMPAIEESRAFAGLRSILDLSREQRTAFPHPPSVWLDATYDAASQWESYAAIAPVAGGTLAQIGGSGSHATKFLLAGAAEAWLITPMVEEVRFGMALAEAAGVGDRFRGVVGIAEELPFANDSFDAIYSGGVVHHMETGIAMPEVARVLKPGGTMSAAEPMRAPLYAAGIKVFGQRESGASCRPLTEQRLGPFHAAFAESVVTRHGALTRYPLIAAGKLGWSVRLETAWKITRFDDRVASKIGLRGLGSGISIVGRKSF